MSISSIDSPPSFHTNKYKGMEVEKLNGTVISFPDASKFSITPSGALVIYDENNEIFRTMNPGSWKEAWRIEKRELVDFVPINLRTGGMSRAQIRFITEAVEVAFRTAETFPENVAKYSPKISFHQRKEGK